LQEREVTLVELKSHLQKVNHLWKLKLRKLNEIEITLAEIENFEIEITLAEIEITLAELKSHLKLNLYYDLLVTCSSIMKILFCCNNYVFTHSTTIQYNINPKLLKTKAITN
jgi:hypothetical protein